MRIRQMSIDDYDSVYRLWASIPGIGLRSLDDSREGIAAFLKRNPCTSFVAEEQGGILGAILCGHDGRRGYIYHTAVDASARGQGTGKALVQAALDALKQEGIHRACLFVQRTNNLGNGFWEAAGFSERTDVVYRNLSLNEAND